MPNMLLRKLRDLGREQLAAVRKNDLDTLEELESERRQLIRQLGTLDMVGLAEGAPDLLDQIVKEIRDTDLLVRSALKEGMQKAQTALGKINDQGRAERAYRGIAGTGK